VPTLPHIDIATVGETSFSNVGIHGVLKVSVIDSVESWMNEMRLLFNFNLIKAFTNRSDFKLLFDGMHGVAGPYATSLFTEILGLSED
jgi:phosphoglucomutase